MLDGEANTDDGSCGTSGPTFEAVHHICQQLKLRMVHIKSFSRKWIRGCRLLACLLLPCTLTYAAVVVEVIINHQSPNSPISENVPPTSEGQLDKLDSLPVRPCACAQSFSPVRQAN